MLNSNEIIKILRNSNIFGEMDVDILAQVAETLEVVEVDAGEVIIQKGEYGDSMFIVIDGHVRVHDRSLVFRKAGKGDVFGEMAALDTSVRSATITAETDTRLLKLERRALFDLVESQPRLVRALIKVLCQHIRRCSENWSDDFYHLEALEHELTIGRKIQAGFLPERLPEIQGWRFSAYFKAARQVAGDFYDVFELPGGNKMGLALGDVCDKGLGAALFMTLFRSLIRAASTSDDFMQALALNCPPEALEQAALDDLARQRMSVLFTNNYIARTHESANMFVTLFLAYLDTTNGVFTYINGGHEPGLLLRAGQVRERYTRTSTVLGLFPDLDFEIRESYLEPGDTLLLYSDGVLDARNPDDERYGEERLLALIEEYGACTATDLTGAIERSLESFIAGEDQFDDITILAVTRM